MKIFTVLYYTQENGGRNEYKVLGTFTNNEEAIEVLNQQYEKDFEFVKQRFNECDEDCSYHNKDSYHLEVDCTWDCGCWIEETDLVVKDDTSDTTKEVLDVYYQPEVYYDDGTNIGWYLPNELFSFQVFRTVEDCEIWLEDNGYIVEDCNITEYTGDDIEDYELVIVF